MKYFALVIPALFLAVFLFAAVKKVKLYDGFAEGVREAPPLILSLFPYLAAILILSELFERSGLSAIVTGWLSPAFSFLGIPPEIGKLVLMKPFSGSGSMAMLSEILHTYGADSYIARCASCAYGSSETVFYISAVYFAGLEKKHIFTPIVVSLIANFIGVICACLFCRIL